MFKTLVILLFIYFLFRFVTRYLFPFFLKKMFNKMEQKVKQQAHKNQPPISEGETVIDKAPRTSKTSDNDVGEYIDYEEID